MFPSPNRSSRTRHMKPRRVCVDAAFGEHLVIDVDRRLGLGEQHALAQPVAQQPGGARVAIVVLVVARLVAVEDQPHDVGRVLLVELLLQLGVDHVVRRRDDVAQRADVAEVVANAAEGLRCLAWESSVVRSCK